MVKLGVYDLGIRRVELYADPHSGGASFISLGTPTSIARIVVGLNRNAFADIVVSLLHEAMELVCSDMGIRWKAHPDYSDAHDSYLFVMTHPQFSEATARAGWFISNSFADVACVYQKHTKKRKQ